MERRQPKPKIIDPFLQEEQMGTDQAPQTSYSQDRTDQQEYAKETKTPFKATKKRGERDYRYTFGWNESEKFSQYIVLRISKYSPINNFIDGVSYMQNH